jgi:glutaredoxin
MKIKKLELYYFPSCPFCQFVLSTISKYRIKVKLTNINEDHSARESLYKETGRYTVPCLYIDESPMHESSDIINWIEKNNEILEKA